jgi:hypothetical protein
VKEPSEERARRAARNENLWRSVNERVEEVRSSPKSMFISFICECPQASCSDEVAMTKEEYETVRRSPDRFVVKRDHVVQEFEHVVDSADDRYAVVQKVGEAGVLAAELDPRAT